MQDLLKRYRRADAAGDNDGALGLDELVDLIRGTGLHMTDIEMEFLFGETFAPTPVAGKGATGRGAAVSRTALQQQRGAYVDKETADKTKVDKATGRKGTGAVNRFATNNDGDDSGSEEDQGIDVDAALGLLGGDDAISADYSHWPKVGERVTLTAQAIYENKDNHLGTKVLGPEDVGLVVALDYESAKLNIEVQFPIVGVPEEDERDTYTGRQRGMGLTNSSGPDKIPTNVQRPPSSWYKYGTVEIEGASHEKEEELYRGEMLTPAEIKLNVESYRRTVGNLSEMRGGISYDEFIGMMGVAYLLKLAHSEREAKVKGQTREDTKKFIEVCKINQPACALDVNCIGWQLKRCGLGGELSCMALERSPCV